MAGANSKYEYSNTKIAVVGITLAVVILWAVKPWELRWTVERAMPAPVEIARDASLAPVQPLLRNVRPIASLKLTREESARPTLVAESPTGRKTVAGIDPKTFRASYTDATNFLVGYKDSAGNVIIPPKFDWGGPFEEGQAKIEYEGKFGIIDLNGQFVVPAEFESIFDFVEGVGVAQKEGWFFFIDTSGRPLSDERFDYAWPHKDGMALVKRDGRFGYADLTGRVTVPVTLEETFGFNEGLAVAKMNGMFGVIDKLGRFAVPPQFDYAWPVEKGSVLVRKNGETFAVDVSQFTEPTTM